MKLTPSILAAITDAAARYVRIGQIAAEIGLSKAEWKAALRVDLESVRLAVLRGRVQAAVANAEALDLCSLRYGNVAATLQILRSRFDWPKPKRGRPPRSRPR